MARKRTPIQREKDLELAARLYLGGHTQREIAELVGVTQQQVSLDLAEIRFRWSAAAVGAMAERTATELAKLDNLERTAWEAWEASRGEGVPGDPRYLATVERCILARVRILGLAAPERTIATVTTLERPLIHLSDSELLALEHGKPEA